jgi:hypothetical protein
MDSPGTGIGAVHGGYGSVMSDVFEHGHAPDHDPKERPEQNKREHASGEPPENREDESD